MFYNPHPLPNERDIKTYKRVKNHKLGMDRREYSKPDSGRLIQWKKRPSSANALNTRLSDFEIRRERNSEQQVLYT
jgi:hypothetical protein